MDERIYIVQPYIAKATRLVPQPAQIFSDEANARRAGGRLSRFRAGVVVMSQCLDPLAGRNAPPEPLAVYGRVPEGWGPVSKAA